MLTKIRKTLPEYINNKHSNNSKLDRMKEKVYGLHKEGEESLPGPRRPLPHF